MNCTPFIVEMESANLVAEQGPRTITTFKASLANVDTIWEHLLDKEGELIHRIAGVDNPEPKQP